ncbi:MFS transporter [Modestobacter sp. I12A-02662]|uniref:MFS transporter n=1 Tax=Modestobacter sp. I12A-02662 TaxID=1730496 RepID=UPI0034DF495C
MQRSPDTLFTPAFIALTLSDLAYCTAGGVLIGVTPFFVTGPLGGGPAAVGLAVGAFSVTTLALRPLAGRWADRRGRRPLLIGGAALFAVLVLGHLLVTEPAWLVVLRLLLGAAEALYFVAGFAALADLAQPGRAGEALSYNSLALYVGLAAGPLMGQALLRWSGFPLVWAATALLLGAAALLAVRVPETLEAVVEAGLPAPLFHPAALVPGLGLSTGVAAVSGFLAFAALYATDLGLDLWSTVPAVFGSVVVTCRVVFATLPDRLPPLRLSAFALGVSGAGLVLCAVVPTAWALVAGAAVLGVGTAFLTPAAFAAVFSRVPPTERGSAAGTATVFIDLGFSGGPVLLGVVAATSSIPVAFLAGAVLTASGAALLMCHTTPAAPLRTGSGPA